MSEVLVWIAGYLSVGAVTGGLGYAAEPAEAEARTNAVLGLLGWPLILPLWVAICIGTNIRKLLEPRQ